MDMSKTNDVRTIIQSVLLGLTLDFLARFNGA